MSRRKRRSAKPSRWLWVIGALVGAAVVYFAYRPRGSGLIPLPGESQSSLAQSPAPKEQIHESDREALDRVLRERAHRH